MPSFLCEGTEGAKVHRREERAPVSEEMFTLTACAVWHRQRSQQVETAGGGSLVKSEMHAVQYGSVCIRWAENGMGM